MNQDPGFYAYTERSERLRMLAALWDELAQDHGCGGFEQEFRPELEHLGRFRREFPQAPPDVLVSLLEKKVIEAMREKFARDRLMALRARLNRSN